MKVRKWLGVLVLLSAAAVAATYGVISSAAGDGRPGSGITDGNRAQGAGVAFNNWASANSITPALGDVITATFSDGWTQQFEVTQITNNAVTGLTAVAGTLVYTGASNSSELDYSDQAGCGGSYEQHYRYWEIVENGETINSGWTPAGVTYTPNC
jgi:hypothetical protein